MGLMEMEVLVLEVEVVFEVVVLEVEVLEVEVLVLEVVEVLVVVPPPGTRYQFAWGSLRHSPAVTPFQPLDWIRPK